MFQKKVFMFSLREIRLFRMYESRVIIPTYEEEENIENRNWRGAFH